MPETWTGVRCSSTSTSRGWERPRSCGYRPISASIARPSRKTDRARVSTCGSERWVKWASVADDVGGAPGQVLAAIHCDHLAGHRAGLGQPGDSLGDLLRAGAVAEGDGGGLAGEL